MYTLLCLAPDWSRNDSKKHRHDRGEGDLLNDTGLRCLCSSSGGSSNGESSPLIGLPGALLNGFDAAVCEDVMDRTSSSLSSARLTYGGGAVARDSGRAMTARGLGWDRASG